MDEAALLGYVAAMPRATTATRRQLLAAEQRRLELTPHGALRVAVGYPNTYHVAHSSLAFQRVLELTGGIDDVGVERTFADPHLAGRSFEEDRPLGEFHVIAWSCSFELDAVHLLCCLRAAGIPVERARRTGRDPLVVVGGAVASINPLPLAPAVDVFCLGAAELVWPTFLRTVMESDSNAACLARLAELDGFFVPQHHLDEQGHALQRVRRLEKRDAHMRRTADIPASTIVTPYTEYRSRGLIEISRGCPEKCRYCWVSHNYGRLRCYPAPGVLERARELTGITRRIGLVATAVGDHPELVAILEGCRELGLDVALSSLRIPAMVPEILQPLAAMGANSVTIAPETGSDRLRASLNKAISNDTILEAVERAQRAGIANLKMYFIVGLPGEEDADLLAIGRLLDDVMGIVRAYGRERGRVGSLHAGISILVPKPYTPYSRDVVISASEARRRLALVHSATAKIGGLRVDRPSYRQAVWQAFLSRAGTAAFPLLLELVDGEPLSQVVARHRQLVEQTTLRPPADSALRHFISSAPSNR